MEEILLKADNVFYILMLLSVGYLFVFAFFSMFGGKKRYPVSSKKLKFAVIIPAYKEDSVIEESVKSMLAQDYPDDKIVVMVVSDQMSDETNNRLKLLPIKLVIINPPKSSKAVALQYAADNLKGLKCDGVIVLDADNVAQNTFVSEINDAFGFGSSAVQTHRTAKNLNNDMAILDAVSEEINNSIFRKGHVCLGLSSALIGSGMAFEYEWFDYNVKKLSTAGEDKEMERLLLKERIFIDYLDYTMLYDEKIQKEEAFFNQRRRWIASQIGALVKGIKDFPGALFSFNIDYLDKILQWMFLPRIVLLGLTSIMSFVLTVINWRLSLKWWLLLIMLLLTFAMALPDFLVTPRNIRAIKKLPVIFIMMVVNFFRVKGVNKNFIHTQKG